MMVSASPHRQHLQRPNGSTLSLVWSRLARLTLPATLCSALLTFALPAQATRYNVNEAADHQHWQSMALHLGDDTHLRAVEAHSYSDSTLSVNATPGVCDLPWLELRVSLGEYQGSDRTLRQVPGLIRVDDEDIHRAIAEFITQRGDDGFYVHFYLDRLMPLLEQMADGEQLFVAFEQGEAAPWHMQFSLAGAGQAISRMLSLCQADDRAQAPSPERPPAEQGAKDATQGES